MRGSRARSLAAGIILSVTCSAAVAQQRDGWLSVKDFSASGSNFETTATATAGSNQIVVREVGDFQVGQGVIVSRCNIQIVSPLLRGPESPYSTKPLGDALEIRGYDGRTSSWLVFLLEIDAPEPLSFRWSDNLVREGKWQGVKVPITWDWQKLSHGIEVKFNKRDLEVGHMVSFSARDQLSSVIEKIEGHKLTLRDAVNRSTADAVVRHDDSLAIQAAVDRAIKEKRNVFFPPGWYRVPKGLLISGAGAICLEGANGVDTVMDISDGATSIFSVRGCTEITIRNFRMIGHTGMAESAGAFRMAHGRASFWACALKPCNAIGMTATERALIENVHASRMGSECFYAWGTARQSTGEQRQYQKSLIYLRCSVTDCAANAFNNNDMGENTSVLYCRIQDAGPGGWHAAEMPVRFLRLIGNYVRNAGPFTIGDLSSRPDDLHRLGCGQSVLNVTVHDNLIRNCQQGLVTRRAQSSIKEVVDSTTFLETSLPLEWKDSHLYRGWNLAWLGGAAPNTLSVIEAFDPVTLRFQLRVPRRMKTGEAFHVFPSGPANWNFHDNTITGCQKPVTLDSYGSPTSLLKNNVVARGAAVGVKAAVEVCGLFQLIGNHVSGFDEQGSAALSLVADPLGRVARSVYRDNVFEKCTAIVPTDQATLWAAAKAAGNVLVECGERDDPNPAPSP